MAEVDIDALPVSAPRGNRQQPAAATHTTFTKPSSASPTPGGEREEAPKSSRSKIKRIAWVILPLIALGVSAFIALLKNVQFVEDVAVAIVEVIAKKQFHITIPSGAELKQKMESYRYAASNKVVDRNGVLIGKLGSENRTVIKYNQMGYAPIVLQSAEDQRLFTHHCVDWQGMVRAMVHKAFYGKEEGGSSVCQQMIKRMFLSSEKTFSRKLPEIVMAYRLGQEVDRTLIVEAYLNHAYFGHGAYGIEEAARYYFGKSAQELTIPEMAALIQSVTAPSKNSIVSNPTKAKNRMAYVFNRMVKDHHINRAQAEEFKQAEVKPVSSEASGPQSEAPEWLDIAQAALDKRYTTDEQPYLGLTITVTGDLKVQRVACAAVEKQLEKLAPTNQKIQGVALVEDAKTGEVLAMCGGRNYRRGGFNLAIKAKVLPGSTFKIVDLAAALEIGKERAQIVGNDKIAYTLATEMDDAEVEFALPYNQKWQPRNYNNERFGTMNLIQALAHSSNTIFAKVIMDIGIAKILEMAKKAGIERKLEALPATGLGTSVMAPIELLKLYATFAAGGQVIDQKFILKIGDQAEQPSKPKQGVDPATAFLVSKAQTAVVEEGTATSLKGLLGKESEIAVKTGTAQDSKSLLLAGYEPNGVTVVVWVGNDDGSAVKGFLNKKTGQPGKAPTGGQVAAPIWGETMKAATEGHKPAKFSPPTSVIEVEGKYYLEGTQLQQPVAPELPTIESSTPSAAPAQPSPTPVSPATQEETEGESNRTE